VRKLPYNIKCDLESGNSGGLSGSLDSRLFNLQWKIQLVSYRTPIGRASSRQVPDDQVIIQEAIRIALVGSPAQIHERIQGCGDHTPIGKEVNRSTEKIVKRGGGE
jgi:hypothetical protein